MDDPPSELLDALRHQIERGLRRGTKYQLSWLSGQRLLEKHCAVDASVVTLYADIGRFERALAKARGPRNTQNPDPTGHWDIVALLSAFLCRKRYPHSRGARLAVYAMDLKFKVHCLLEADLPAYVARVEAMGTSSRGGQLVGLSWDATLGFKARAVWETVMNLVYWLETGKERETLGRRGRSEKWWVWVRSSREWRSLSEYKQLVTRFDELLRTPEAHKASRLRPLYVAARSPIRHRALAQRLVDALIAFWDHLVVVLTFDAVRSSQRGLRISRARHAVPKPDAR